MSYELTAVDCQNESCIGRRTQQSEGREDLARKKILSVLSLEKAQKCCANGENIWPYHRIVEFQFH